VRGVKEADPACDNIDRTFTFVSFSIYRYAFFENNKDKELARKCLACSLVSLATKISKIPKVLLALVDKVQRLFI
jgi:hypothetical protein